MERMTSRTMFWLRSGRASVIGRGACWSRAMSTPMGVGAVKGRVPLNIS
jgi:hypothetical protein